MDILFENTFPIPLERYLYMSNHPVGGVARRQLARWRGICAALVVAGIAIAVIAAQMENAALLIVLGIAVTVAAVIKITVQRPAALKKQYEYMRKGCFGDGAWIRRVVFTEDGVSEADGNAKGSYSYGEFCDLTENGEWINLWRGKDFVLRLRKDSFTVGQASEFAAFFRERIAAEKKQGQ